MTEQTFDLVILGGGSGGYACALRASQLGLSVVLIEKDKLGGTCLHRGCVPTKALLHAAEVADSARHAHKVGVTATFEKIDLPTVNKYKDGVVDRLYKGVQGLIKRRQVTYVSGTGRMTGPRTVTVDGVQYTGRSLVLGTGSLPRSLPGLEIGGRIMTSDEALELDWIPNSVLVLGGGVIGAEFASVWRSFGADVTIIEGLPRLLPLEDESVSQAFERAFRKRKIKFKTGVRFESAQQDGNSVTITLEDGQTMSADLLLVAIGRGPNTADMGFEQQGLKMDRGFIPTNDVLETNLPGVFAVGDVVPGLQLAHRGFAQGMIVAEHVAGLDTFPVDESAIPRVTYCEPEVASVGLTEAQAREEYGDDQVDTFEYNLGGNAKSQILETAGFIKLVREKDGPVVGIHMVGDRIGEQIGEAQMIYSWEAFPEDVARLVHAHPTQNEAIGEAHMALAGRPLHAHS